ncbi:MAG: hypothetical protein KG003_06900 [Bacteroidetes bacterium]|nr:hypothetical protein [Bacteroidota bacterium]
MKQLFLWISFFAFVAVSCNPKKQVPFDYGNVVNNIYKNNFFQFKLQVPHGWKVLSKDEKKKLSEKGRDYITQGNEGMKDAFKASEINTANLLSIFRYEVNPEEEYNCNFIIMAENLKNNPKIKNGEDYLYVTKQVIQKTNIQISSADSKFEKVKLGGRDFFRMNMTLSVMGMEIQQSYFALLDQGFALGMVMSYVTESDKKLLDDCIHSVTFNN